MISKCYSVISSYEKGLSLEYRSAFRHLVLQPSILRIQKYLIMYLLKHGFYITNPKLKDPKNNNNWTIGRMSVGL